MSAAEAARSEIRLPLQPQGTRLRTCVLVPERDGAVTVRGERPGGPVLLVVDDPQAFAAALLEMAALASEWQVERQVFSTARPIDSAAARKVAKVIRASGG